MNSWMKRPKGVCERARDVGTGWAYLRQTVGQINGVWCSQHGCRAVKNSSKGCKWEEDAGSHNKVKSPNIYVDFWSKGAACVDFCWLSRPRCRPHDSLRSNFVPPSGLTRFWHRFVAAGLLQLPRQKEPSTWARARASVYLRALGGSLCCGAQDRDGEGRL